MMDLQKLVDALGKAAELERANYHMTLGKMIERLGQMPGDAKVVFGDGNGPTRPHSYRGYYSDLAFRGSNETVLVRDFLADCVGCDGQVFVGYKGGDYTMHERTPLWRAEYGDCGDAIIDAVTVDGKCLLVTKAID